MILLQYGQITWINAYPLPDKFKMANKMPIWVISIPQTARFSMQAGTLFDLALPSLRLACVPAQFSIFSGLHVFRLLVFRFKNISSVAKCKANTIVNLWVKFIFLHQLEGEFGDRCCMTSNFCRYAFSELYASRL